MQRSEEELLINQNNEMHEIICGKKGKPGLCEDVRQLSRRVSRIEAAGKWLGTIFSALFITSWGLIWRKLWP